MLIKSYTFLILRKNFLSREPSGSLFFMYNLNNINIYIINIYDIIVIWEYEMNNEMNKE